MTKLAKGNLKVSSAFLDFINNEVIPGTNIDPNDFWNKFDNAVHELAPVNKKLLDKRMRKKQK